MRFHKERRRENRHLNPRNLFIFLSASSHKQNMRAPVLLDADSTALTIQWAAAQAATTARYEVQLAASAEREWTTLSSTLQSTVLRKKNLVPRTSYLFRVRSKTNNEADWTAFSPPSAPLSTLGPNVSRIQEAPTSSEVTSDAITVTWSAVRGCTAYELQMAAVLAEGRELVWTTLSSSIKAAVVKKKGESNIAITSLQHHPLLLLTTSAHTKRRTASWSSLQVQSEASI
jgi:Fibronectin type III domain